VNRPTSKTPYHVKIVAEKGLVRQPLGENAQKGFRQFVGHQIIAYVEIEVDNPAEIKAPVFVLSRTLADESSPSDTCRDRQNRSNRTQHHTVDLPKLQSIIRVGSHGSFAALRELKPHHGLLVSGIRCAVAGEPRLLVLDTCHGLGSSWHLTAKRPKWWQFWALGVFLSK
jgi:hypothetical protein